MLKYYLILITSLFSKPIFAQQEIENWSHPFQVLFVDSATYVGTGKPLRPFDFIGKYDLINNYGKLVLLHYSGAIEETEAATINIRQLDKPMQTDKYVERPLVSDPKKFINKSINPNYRLDPLIAPAISGTQDFEIVYPDAFESGVIYADSLSDHLHLIWKTAHRTDSFHIVFVNAFDEEIFTLKSKASEIKIPRSMIEKSKFPVFEIRTADGQHGTGYRKVRFQNLPKRSAYDRLVAALREQWSGSIYLSHVYFKEAVIASNQDSRFIDLYRRFLDRNPTLELTLEE